MGKPRGKVTLSQSNPLMRMYEMWRGFKGREATERKQIDLCHFMRVVLIFGPLRWFAQRDYKVGVGRFSTFLPPMLMVGFSLSMGGFVAACICWPTIMLAVIGGFAFGVGVVALAILAFKKLDAWITNDPEHAALVLGRIMDKFTWPFVKVWLGLAWFAKRVIFPVARLGDKTLWYSMNLGIRFTFYKIVFATLVSAWACYMIGYVLIYQGFVLHFWWALAGTGIVVGVVAFIFAMIAGAIKAKDAVQARASAAQLRPSKPPREHETAKALWAFVVSKKHRICPLIEVKA